MSQGARDITTADLGTAWQQANAAERQKLSMERPDWVADDALRFLFEAEPTLLREGRVVWGALIQANNMLFVPGGSRGGAPGEVLYDPQGTMPPEELAAAARTVFSLKGRRMDDRALAAFSKYLADEMIRVFGLDVPTSVSAHPVKTSTTYFDRRHLPGGRIADAVFPVLICDAQPGALMVLPQAFWPQALREQWAPPQPPPPDFGPPGSPEALYNEALALFTGRGVAQDPVRAHELWTQAAAAGHVDAMVGLGRQHEAGMGVARSIPLAVQHLRRAAEHGHRDAQVHLGRLLLLKTEKTHDRQEAARWLKLAVDQDSEEAEDLLSRHGLWGDEKRSLLSRLFGR